MHYLFGAWISVSPKFIQDPWNAEAHTYLFLLSLSLFNFPWPHQVNCTLLYFTVLYCTLLNLRNLIHPDDFCIKLSVGKKLKMDIVVLSTISSNQHLHMRAITDAHAASVALETFSGKHRLFAWSAVYYVCIISDFSQNCSIFFRVFLSRKS